MIRIGIFIKGCFALLAICYTKYLVFPGIAAA